MSLPKESTLVVTGGAGFIGTATTKALLDAGAGRVVIYDIRPAPESLDPRIEYVCADIRDVDRLNEAVRGAYGIVHLAALISVAESMEHPKETHEVNVTGTVNVLEAARINGVKRMVYASSAAVYGNNPELPKKESMNTEPCSPYALSKVQNELDARLYSALFNVHTTGLRFFNVYGKGQKAGNAYASVIPIWVKAIQEGKTPLLYGTGEQTRDFVHVRDVARAIVAALSADTEPGTVMNIGSGTERSLNETWKAMAEATGTGLELERVEMRAGDIGRSVADIGRARELLDFTPEVAFTEGISELFI